MANWIIGGTLILALTPVLSLNNPPKVPPQSIAGWGGVTAAEGQVATIREPQAGTAWCQSPTSPETTQPLKIFPLGARFLLTPLTHSQPVLLLPRANRQFNNSLRLSGPRGQDQLKSDGLSDRLLTDAGYYLHTPYRRGGSLQTGHATDCSGFVQYIYQKFNVNLPRSSSEQAQVGKVAARTMDFAKLVPADLLFFSRAGRHIGHVGIYLGEGKMIHASNRRHGVIITDLRQPYFEGTFVVAKRILKDNHYQ